MKKLILSVLMAFCTTMLLAQTVTVKGTVIGSEDGLPIIGAYVVEQGTQNVASTDIDGNYVITVPKLATLVVSSVGYHDRVIPVQGRQIINVSLAPETINLDEVMVVAYGTVKKGSYSGSATVVKQDAMKDAPVVSFESVLAGKAPGVQVASFSGQPGAQADISIRGFGSFNAGNAPLYVIDGVPATSGDWASGNMSTSAMSYLNPSDIESITVLKDAAAASLYGSRASNGVILITTKKGKSGKLTSTFKASAGFSYFAYDNYPLASDAQMEELHRQAWYNYGERNPSKWKSYGSLDNYTAEMVEKYYPARDYDKYIYRDWEDVLFRTGISQNYEYSVSGGGEKGKIYASVAYTDQQGVVSIDNLQRFSTTINGETNLNKFIKIGGNLQYSRQFQEGHQEGASTKDNPFFIWKVVLNPRWPYAYKEDGSLYLERWNSSYSTINPVASYNAQINDAKQNRLIIKGFVEAKFTDYLTAKTTLSTDWLYVHDRFGWLYGHPNYTAYSDQGGYMSDRHRNVNRTVSSTTLNFDKTWGDHHVAALAGWEAEEEKYHMTRIGKIDFSYAGATESIFGTNYEDGYAYSREEGLLSALGSLSYDYKAKYYLTGTFRRDGSSRLAPETRWGNFWSVSGSWRFSNEDFLEYEWLNDGKLRGSYGTSGTLPSDYFGYMSVYDFEQYGSAGASYPGNLANTDLTWEKNKNWNVAVDATIFDKYNFTVEYFEKKTTDLLLDAKVPSTTGFSTTLTNIGSMSNKGWEIAVNVDIIKDKDIDLSVGANWSTIKNKVLALSEEGEQQVNNRQIWKAGYCFYQYYTRDYLGVNKETGMPMYARGTFHEGGKPASEDVTLKNGTKIAKGETVPYDTYNYTPTTRSKANSMILDGKTALPKGYGGFNVDFRYKNLSFIMAWSYKYGNYMWDNATDDLCVDGYYWSHRNMLASEVDTWSPENPNGSIPIRIADNTEGGYYDSSRAIHKGDFLRLKNLTVSYTLPKTFTQKYSISNARVYVAGANLLTFSGLHVDPELPSDGYYNFGMPAMRTVTLGLEVSF
ncbi:MAG: TonB-dependent receptor [Bacteroidales bacterium]|nr:TonB-dependent receptor [Bacteroidales bacterium]